MERLIIVPSLVSMISRGPTSGSAGLGAAEADSEALVTVERLEAALFFAVFLVGAFAGLLSAVASAVSAGLSVAVTFGAVLAGIVSLVFAVAGVRLPVVRVDLGLLRAAVGGVTGFGAGSVTAGFSASDGGDESMGAVADGASGVGAEVTSTVPGVLSSIRAPVDDTLLVFLSPPKVAAAGGASVSSMSAPPRTGSNEPPKYS